MSTWDARFLGMAQFVSAWSKDPSTKVGAVIVRPDRTVVSVGYNGFPRGCDDDTAMLADRPTKYLRTVHAEVNAIIKASEKLGGCTLYVYPLHPCATCAGIIIQSGISRVVAFTKDDGDGRWEEQFKQARQMFEEAGVRIVTVTAWGAQ